MGLAAEEARERPDGDRADHGPTGVGEAVDARAAADVHAPRPRALDEHPRDHTRTACDTRVPVAAAEHRQHDAERASRQRGRRGVRVQCVPLDQHPLEPVVRQAQQAEHPRLECELQTGAYLRERRRHAAQDCRLDAPPELRRPVTLEHRAGSVKRGVGEHERPVPPRDLEAERAKDGRSRTEREEGAAEVVHEPRLDQLSRAHRAARLLLCLVHHHRPAVVGEHVRRDETVVPRPDDDGVRRGDHASGSFRRVTNRTLAALSEPKTGVTNDWYAPRRMQPQGSSFSLAGAGSVLIGFTAACIAVGALIGWAMGNVGYGFAFGAVAGIPVGVAATVIRYRNI
jgi:hypothetical protein